MGSGTGMRAGTKPVLSPQEHSQILKSLLNELPQNQPGYPQRGHPAQKAQSSPHHHQQQRQQAEQQRQQQQHKQQMPQVVDGKMTAGALVLMIGVLAAMVGKEVEEKEAAGEAEAGEVEAGEVEEAEKAVAGGGDYDGWHDGGGDGWDKLAQGNDKGWEQNDGWESHENSWSNNAKGSTNNWGAKDEWSTNKDAWATADDAWGNNDGGDEDDGWDEEEDDWEESHRYHQVSPSEGISKQEHVWGGSQTESHYFMPSKTLAHALNGTQLKPTNGVPPNKMDEYTNVKFLESRNAAFAPVQRAIFGRERKARDRVHWMFSPDKDDRVSAILAWIQAMEYNLGSFGLHKFLQTRERGALFVNVTFRHQERQNQPVFDWLTFDEIQSSADRTLQESVLSYDPAMQVVIFVYLPSKSGNSVGDVAAEEIAIAKGGLRRDKDYVVHVDELPPKNKGKAAPKPALTKAAAKQAAKQAAKEAKQAKQVPAKSALVKHQRVQSLPVIPEKKKRKWWQILRFED
ncbi:hypothetical protein FPV67DRAFT_1664422 [Lyophyllum atratum]|nr:hypothetical protein FPV67DRAFT_1664422 [Lyophyllum atratum]